MKDYSDYFFMFNGDLCLCLPPERIMYCDLKILRVVKSTKRENKIWVENKKRGRDTYDGLQRTTRDLFFLRIWRPNDAVTFKILSGERFQNLLDFFFDLSGDRGTSSQP